MLFDFNTQAMAPTSKLCLCHVRHERKAEYNRNVALIYYSA